ncbi:hypothetical protein DFR78_1161, partial [Halanaerobium sp. MA284_MarDTE_T2]
VLNAFIVVFRRLILVFETCKLENIICFLCYNQHISLINLINIAFLTNFIKSKYLIIPTKFL